MVSVVFYIVKREMEPSVIQDTYIISLIVTINGGVAASRFFPSKGSDDALLFTFATLEGDQIWLTHRTKGETVKGDVEVVEKLLASIPVANVALIEYGDLDELLEEDLVILGISSVEVP